MSDVFIHPTAVVDEETGVIWLAANRDYLTERGARAGGTLVLFRSDDSGKNVRYISKIASLHDVAVVSTPAYPKAGAAIRSFKRWQKQQAEAQLDTNIPVDLQGRLSVLRNQARRSSF